MRRLIALSLLLIALFGIVSAALILPIRSNADYREDRLLPMSDCALPCFAGETLGKSTLDEAVQQISKRVDPNGYVMDKPSTTESSIFYRWKKRNLSTGRDSIIYIIIQKGVLAELGIYFDPDDKTTPKLADAPIALGTSLCYYNDGLTYDFNLNDIIGLSEIYYFGKGYQLEIISNSLKIDQPIQEIILRPASTTLICQAIGSFSWRGFVSKYR